MIYGYARVSTVNQQKDGNSLEDQVKKLKEHGAVEVYTDAFTGTKVDRPELKKLLEVIQPGDTLIATKLDRVSRSVAGGIELIEQLLDKGVAVHILNMGMMDNTPTGRLIRTVMLAFAQFERDMIVERTKEGRDVARQREGYREGRPPKEVDMTLFENLRKKQKDGHLTVTECCEELGVSRRTWYNIIERNIA